MAFDEGESIYRALVRDICIRASDSSQEVQREKTLLEEKLEASLVNTLKTLIPAWKRNGGMAEISVVYALPASNMIREDVDSYERVVYGTAKKILRKNGFVLEENRWHYRK
ncbi:MAG: hypothetical protein Q8R18_05285 [bacterium]|nr:hypothetical protein [bacterium]